MLGHAPEYSEDSEMLHRALEQSAREHRATASALHLSSAYATPRSGAPQRPGPPALPHGTPRRGLLRQINLFNQFHESFVPLVTEFTAPHAICGYCACAAALVLNRDLSHGVEGTAAAAGVPSEATALAAAYRLRDVEGLKPTLREAMAHVLASRQRYIAAHAEEFAELGSSADAAAQDTLPPSSPGAYRSSWVANYEISDFLRSRCVA
jgi:hypothetical protein